MKLIDAYIIKDSLEKEISFLEISDENFWFKDTFDNILKKYWELERINALINKTELNSSTEIDYTIYKVECDNDEENIEDFNNTFSVLEIKGLLKINFNLLEKFERLFLSFCESADLNDDGKKLSKEQSSKRLNYLINKISFFKKRISYLTLIYENAKIELDLVPDSEE